MSCGKLEMRTLQYLDIEDICEKFNLNIRDFAFSECADNGSYIWFGCDADWIEDYNICAEDVAGSRYEQRYLNNIMLAKYLNEEMGITDGVMIHIYW